MRCSMRRTAADIIARETLDRWATTHARLRVVHTLTREPVTSTWEGSRGRVDLAMLRKQLPTPTDDMLVFICGPPGMYTTLSGARSNQLLSGALAQLGFRADQVVKL